MEEPEENHEGEELKKDTRPEKIALKVPTLCIKSPTKSSNDSNEAGPRGVESNHESPAPTKSNKRPMPASARKKLEESKQTERSSFGINNGEVEVDGNTQTGNGGTDLEEEKEKNSSPLDRGGENLLNNSTNSDKKKMSRPMPASARRKQEESRNKDAKSEADVKDTTAEANSKDDSLELEPVSPPTPPSKPLTSAEKKFGRAMPLFAKKKLELNEHVPDKEDADAERISRKTDEVSLVSNVSSSSSVSIPKKTGRPMPASAKRNLEKKRNEDLDTQKAGNTPEPEQDKDEESEVSSSNKVQRDLSSDLEDDADMPANRVPDNESCEPESRTEELSRVTSQSSDENHKKINISLGGIKFPTFKKPMPASARRKLEDEHEVKPTETQPVNNDNETDDNSAAAADDQEDMPSQRRGRSSRSNKELKALVDEKHTCQYCGEEFFKLTNKNKHEERHLVKLGGKEENMEVSAKTKGEKSNKPQTTNKTKNVSSGRECPKCQKRLSKSKYKSHVKNCGRIRNPYNCYHCSRSFSSKLRLSIHIEKDHIVADKEDMGKDDKGKEEEEHESNDENDSKSSTKGSVVENYKEMPRSVKAKLEQQDGDEAVAAPSAKVNSFKRKIAEVLSSLGSRPRQKGKAEEREEDDQASPKRKKSRTTNDNEEKNDRIQGRPMPASVREKLESRKEAQESKSLLKDGNISEESQSLHILECEVCHRVFTQMCSRQKHEKVVHSILNPRGYGKSQPSGTGSQSSDEKKTRQSSKSEEEPAKSTKSKANQPGIDVSTVPVSGECPVCRKFIATRLRRHVANVHKSLLLVSSTLNTSNSSSPIKAKLPVEPNHRLNAPKSYKIYKTATDKIKKKLATSSSTNPKIVVPKPKSEKGDPEENDETKEKIKHESTRRSGRIRHRSPSPLVEQELDDGGHDGSDMEVSKEETEEVLPDPPKKSPETRNNVTTSDVICACCDKTFTVKCDFNRHMEMKHTKMKRIISCKLCSHMFSHEGDFILHIQFRHRDLVFGMEERSRTQNSSKTVISNPSPAEAVESSRQSRSGAMSSNFAELPANKTAVAKPGPKSKKKENSQSCGSANSLPKSSNVSVFIPKFEKIRADDLLETGLTGTPSTRYSGRLRTNRDNRTKIRTPDPEPQSLEDAFDNDDHFDDTSMMEADDNEPDIGIAITSTFSQKRPSHSPPPPSTRITRRSDLGSTYQSNNNTNRGLDEMPCSTCSEVFHSYEALRKHELYFHNVKTTKMCPICGTYPTRLGRHLLAHENKTVRCSCAPCRLNFSDFSQLLKHNLDKHPGPQGGALCASNKPRELNEAVAASTSQNLSDAEPEACATFRCKVCLKQFSGGAQARRHVRRTHCEIDDDSENYVEEISSASPHRRISNEEKNDDKEDIQTEMEQILEDTSKKLMDPDWDDDDDHDYEPPPPVLEKFSTPSPASTSVSESKPKKPVRAMPASVRAKLEAQQKQSEPTPDKPESSAGVKKPRPMPASVRAKLENQNKADATADSSKPAPLSKPGRPMPASIRAKLMSQLNCSNPEAQTSSAPEKASAKPSSKPRAMPASVRAKLAASKPLNESNNHDSDIEELPVENNVVPTAVQKDTNDDQVVVILSDDDDVVEMVQPEPDSDTQTPGAPAFSIADEIAEHNRAVRMAMGDYPTESLESKDYDLSMMFQCKLCQKKFDGGTSIRRHIRKVHCEYGPDHTENLIQNLHDSIADAPRRRKSRVNYREDVEDDDDDEVFIPRGTSRRPVKTNHNDASGINVIDPPAVSLAKPKSVKSVSSLNYACGICGKRLDAPSNVKRHISKAHPKLWGPGVEGQVVFIEPGKEAEFDQSFTPTSYSSPMSTPITQQQIAATPIAYRCKACSLTADKRVALYQHIRRDHPEIVDLRGQSSEYIEDVFDAESLQNGTTSENYTETEHHFTYPNPQLDLTDEHAGAEPNDEAEICMEEMVEVGEISVTTSSRIEIDQPKPVFLNSRIGTENKKKPGPASRTKKSFVTETEESEPAQEDNAEQDDKDVEMEDLDAPGYSYPGGDLSSLFSTLGGGGAAPGGLDAMDDIHGGMELD